MCTCTSLTPFTYFVTPIVVHGIGHYCTATFQVIMICDCGASHLVAEHIKGQDLPFEFFIEHHSEVVDYYTTLN